MKTLKTLFATTLIALTVSLSSFAADVKIPPIQKIIVKGNAMVVLVQKERESVVVFETLNPETSNIKMVGNTLMINSAEDKPTTVVVYVDQLYRIEASGHSSVSVRGQLKVPYFQVILHDYATANVNVVTKSLYTVIDDRGKLKLKGVSNDHIISRSNMAKLTTDKFASITTTSSNLDHAVAKIVKIKNVDYQLAMEK
jgi:hypothetical protein